ncbi:DUF3231 family protein [Mesobacillus foraminis]|uniref:DUF3231 family protein n=1 Tax=Mesobacillus foraminis TaxID=279826 RepID=UPI001BEC2556|nr:DUF3231 family protein [Mesobacillus foraminis]MBT2755439.1 DUF3231 family protein [Mesobacillus foraminis]
MDHKSSIPLTSSEIAYLWTNFMGDSMAECVLGMFLRHAEDSDVKEMLALALQLSKNHLDTARAIFLEAEIPVPKGFTTEDVNPEAPPLYSDTFYLYYIRNMTKGGLSSYGYALPNTYRADIRKYMSEALESTIELYNRVTETLLEKGLNVRSPVIPTPLEVDFAGKQSFLSGWFGPKRSLSFLEISHLHSNIETNVLGQALIAGFAQTAKTREIKEYFQRGWNLSLKNIKVLSGILTKDKIISSGSVHLSPLNSQEPIFSEKLMMYHSGLASITGVGNYGVCAAQSQRRDLIADYLRLAAEVGLYTEDGANLSIKYGWLEKPPLSPEN